MAEYIDRQSVIDLVDKGFLVSNANYGSVSRIVRQIPAADVAPVRRGRWIPLAHGTMFACSECKYVAGKYNFCPKCGADMREGKGKT